MKHNLEKINVDLKKILGVLPAVSKDLQRYVLMGVYIKDFLINNKVYREYVGCDGKILLLIREEIEKAEILDGITLLINKVILKSSFKKMEELKIELQKVNNSYINTDFNINFEIIDGVYPNYSNVIPKQITDFNEQFIINWNYLKIIKEFFNKKDLQYCFYSIGKNKQLVQADRDYKGTIKIAVVMPITNGYLQDKKTTNEILKEFSKV
jgi:hypothetical protein